jgi:hypothetical protein
MRTYRRDILPVSALVLLGSLAFNLLTPPGSWLIVPEPLLSCLLESSVGATNAARLRPLATFDKPGERTRLAIYEVTEAD